MGRIIKSKFTQPPSSFFKETRKDLGQMVDDKNVLKNVTEVNKKSEGGRLPTYKEAWEMDLDGIKNMYGGYDEYVADMENIKPGDERDKEREAAREKAAKGKDEKSYETKDVAKPGKPGDKTNPFTSAQGRGQSRYNKSQSRLAIQAARKAMRAGTISRDEFEQTKKDIRKQQMDAQMAMAGNAADQLKQGRNPYTSGEAIEYRKEMSKGQEGSDITKLTDVEVEERGLDNVDELKRKNENPSAVGNFGLNKLTFGRRK